MNIDELRSVQSKERQKSDLQQLRESFYGDVAEYIAELEAERERVASNTTDPFGSPEVQQLTDDIETAKDTAEAIYERRLGKIVKKASLVSAEMANPNDVNGLTAEEQTLFADLVARIEDNKAHMLDVIAGDAPPGTDGVHTDDVDTDGVHTDESTAAVRDDPEANAASASDQEGPPVPDDLAAGDAPDRATDARARDARGGEADVAAADVMTGDTGESSPETDSDAPTEADTDAYPKDGIDARSGDDSDARSGDDSGAHPASGTDADSEDGIDGRPEADTEVGSGDDGAGATASDDASRATLRVTEDVGEIFGVDEREYTLEASDVVTLPEENADVLVSQGAAERLD